MEERHAACLEELRLNRRMAANVYLAVMPVIRQASGAITLGESGEIVDWVVQMRRLPADRMLDVLVLGKQLTPYERRMLATTLAQYYASAIPLIVSPAAYRQRIEAHVRANCQELLAAEHDLSAALVKRVHADQLQLLMLRPHLFDLRVCDGRVIEGHGDLRPEHICLEATPVVFDCVEFNADFRQVDVVDELSFLAMECDRLRAPEVGSEILEAYLRSSGDQPSQELVPFFKSYRACVRAKVAALRARQSGPDGRREQLALARQYLELAETYLAPSAMPLAIVVCGLSGTGKSTLAARVAETLGAELLRTDVIRQKVFRDSSANDQRRLYTVQSRCQVYDEMLARADTMLQQRLSVVLDGTFLARLAREKAMKIAKERMAMGLIVHCHCPPEVAWERIAARIAEGSDPSEARPELHEQQRSEEELPLDEDRRIEVATTSSIACQLQAVICACATDLSPEAEHSH